MVNIERAQRAALTTRALGGVARTRTLLGSHVSRHDIGLALGAGLLQRVRQGWVAEPGADRMLLDAARHGAVLSCVTQAKRLELWVHDEQPDLHWAADPRSAGGKPEHVHMHWAKPLIPRHPDVLEDPIENVLALVADCEPHERALATWESAMNKGLVSREVLARLPLKRVARDLLAEAVPFADSGLETYLRTRLGWLGVRLTFQTWIAGHRVDLLIGDRLVLQIDGATHTGAQRSEDIRHDAELRLMGYHVIRVSYRQVMEEWHVVQDLIMRAVAQGLHLA
ncbi:endonuclease domain-containing protein [Microbacterium sp. NPDC057650]|uniref:endonuclease domain-containing protein n=1 Tax=unclassified Microbacterium TaxID=2609290 RepID=UPI00366F4980